MKKEDKNLVIEALGAQLTEFSHFYLVNIEGLDAAKTSDLRRACFKKDIKLLVAKNTLLQKALEKKGVQMMDYDQKERKLYSVKQVKGKFYFLAADPEDQEDGR